MGVDMSRAFRTPFNDPDWIKKTLLGWLWVLLVVTTPAIYGAAIEYIQRVSRGDERLPEWDDFGGKWVKGLVVAVAGFLYFLPILVVGGLMVVPVVVTTSMNAERLAGLFVGSMCIFWVLAAAYGIAVSVLFYAAMVNYAMKGHFGAFFEVGEILQKVRRPGGNYFTAWLYSLVIAIGASVVTSVLSATYIGAVLVGAVVYLELIMVSHLFGQWARDAYAVAPAYVPQAPQGPQPPPPPTAPVPYQPYPPAAAPPAYPSTPPTAPPVPAAPPVAVPPPPPPIEAPAPPVAEVSAAPEPPAPDVPVQESTSDEQTDLGESGSDQDRERPV